MTYCKEIKDYEDHKWYLIDRKPSKCPYCGNKTIAKAVLGYPLEEDWYNDKIFNIGCLPSPFPEQEKFGCNTCDSRFFKDTPKARAYLNGESEFYDQYD